MFLRSRNPLPTFQLSYHVRVTLKIQVNFRFKRYWWFFLVNFHNFFSIDIFEVKESNADIPTDLLCWSDLENPGKLPVQEVLEGTDDFVLWIFTISSVFMFSRSRNPLPTFPVSCYIWVTSEIQVNFRYRRYSKVLMIVSYRFLKFLHYFMFLRSRNPLPTFQLSYHVRVTFKYLLNRKLTLIFKVTRTW